MGTIAQDTGRIEEVSASQSLPFPSEQAGGRFDRTLNVLEALSDGLVSACAVIAALVIKQHLNLGTRVHYAAHTILIAGAVCGAFMVLLLDRDGAYRSGNSLMQIKETERILRISTLAAFLAVPVIYITGHLIPSIIIGLSTLLVVISLIATKQFFYSIAKRLRARGFGARNVVIYGAGDSGRRVFSALARSPKLGLLPTAIVDDDPLLQGQEVFDFGYRRTRSLRVEFGPVTADFLRRQRAKLLVIAVPSLSSEQMSSVLKTAHDAGVGVAYMPQTPHAPELSADVIDIDGLLLVSYRAKNPLAIRELVKRLMDLLLGGLVLALLSPVVALIALLIRLDSPGPVLFVQERVGQGGKLFRIYKFRSMRVSALPYASSPTNVEDPRITRFGRFLRRSSMDELPQLLNVMKGEMSLVGPRPEMPFVVDRYTPTQYQRLSVLPGITGLWQLSADRGFPIHENVQYDLYYIRHQGFFLDLAVLIHTLVFAMNGV